VGWGKALGRKEKHAATFEASQMNADKEKKLHREPAKASGRQDIGKKGRIQTKTLARRKKESSAGFENAKT